MRHGLRSPTMVVDCPSEGRPPKRVAPRRPRRSKVQSQTKNYINIPTAAHQSGVGHVASIGRFATAHGAVHCERRVAPLATSQRRRHAWHRLEHLLEQRQQVVQRTRVHTYTRGRHRRLRLASRTAIRAHLLRTVGVVARLGRVAGGALGDVAIGALQVHHENLQLHHRPR